MGTGSEAPVTAFGERESTQADKAQIRSRVLARRDALPARIRSAASRCIADAIVALPAFRAARVIMTYCSFGSEFDTGPVMAAALAQRKTLVLPRVARASTALELYQVSDPQRDLVAVVWGIREPNPALCAPATSAMIDFILVPGVAFDPQGARIGYGKGYYDRLLGERMAHEPRLCTVAGAFDAQMIDRVPVEAHDVAVASVVTESRYFSCLP